ncbi:MAG: YraN family protein [Caldimicrobium sp.]|jgi:putative endonuclease
MRVSKRAIGKEAEVLVENYFKEKGYEILDRNFHTKLGEIDLIIRKGETLIFVEIKSESISKGFFPEERVDFKKQERIKRAAEIFWLKNFQKLSKIKEIRFDVVVVNLESGEIRHYERAFYAEGNFS